MNRDLYASSNNTIISGLGKRYAEYRKRMGYTQKEIAEQTGLSIFTISSFESGSSKNFKRPLAAAVDNLSTSSMI